MSLLIERALGERFSIDARDLHSGGARCVQDVVNRAPRTHRTPRTAPRTPYRTAHCALHQIQASGTSGPLEPKIYAIDLPLAGNTGPPGTHKASGTSGPPEAKVYTIDFPFARKLERC